MEQTPFQVQPLRSPSFLRKLLKQPVEENAVIEINNLLATTAPNRITNATLQDIIQKYKTDIFKEFALNMQEFYVVYLHYTLLVNEPEQDKQLAHLQSLLQLPDDVILPFHLQIGEKHFRQAVLHSIKDGLYTPSDQAALQALAHTLRLPSDLTSAISMELRQDQFRKRMAPIAISKRLSPTMKMDLLVLAKNLSIDLLKDATVKKQLHDFEKWWQLENNPIPILQTDIDLTRNELCHFEAIRVSWYEDRVTRRGGATPTLIKKGTLYLTSKQLIFVSEDVTSRIRLDKIVRLVHASQGIEIIKDAGRNPTLYLGDETESFHIILKHLIKQHNQ